jgi:hypothetical protein
MRRDGWPQASSRVDFHQVCASLAEAAKPCAPDAPPAGMATQKRRLKNTDGTEGRNQLRDDGEAEEVAPDQAPVRAGWRYWRNRPHHLEYQGALAKGLPLGSGAIERAHRYVIQQRLKLPGAWWTADPVEPLLALRVVRANEDWEKYWDNLAAAA